jgi:hypothetical protein
MSRPAIPPTPHPNRNRLRRPIAGLALGVIALALVGAVLLVGGSGKETGALNDSGGPSSSPVGGDDISLDPRPSPSLSRATPIASVGPVVPGYLTSREELTARINEAGTGAEPMRTALDALLREAERAARRDPRPENPLRARGERFLNDTRDAYTLALAWTASGDVVHAEAARDRILAWVTSVDEVRNTCPDSGGSECATSLLISRNAPAFVFAADLLEGSPAWQTEDRRALSDWLSDLILPSASYRTNNWGDAGVFMRLVVSDYVGDEDEFLAAVADWQGMMDLVEATGEIPEETRRGSLGILYTQGAISYKVAAAAIAERRGIDLWDYEGRRGGTLRAAVDLLARSMQSPSTWEWHDGDMEMPSVDPAWELIYARWPERAFAEIFLPVRPLGETNPSAIIWTTLTNGEPIDEDAGPS